MQTIARKVGPNDQLFGAVTNKQLMELVKEKFGEHFTATAQFSITTVNGKAIHIITNHVYIYHMWLAATLICRHNSYITSSRIPYPSLLFLSLLFDSLTILSSFILTIHQAAMRMEGIVQSTLMTIS